MRWERIPRSPSPPPNWENASGIFNETANVGGTDFTEWFDYTLDVAESGIYAISMEVACGNEVGAPNGVRVASSTGGSTVARCLSPKAGRNMRTITAELRLTAGVQKLTFTADYEGWNLKGFTITYLHEVTSITYDGLAFDQANTQDCGNLIDGEKGRNLHLDAHSREYLRRRALPPALPAQQGCGVRRERHRLPGLQRRTVVEDVTPTAEGVSREIGNRRCLLGQVRGREPR